MDLEPLDKEILSFLHGRDGASTREIADKIGRPPRATRTRPRRLQELGLLIPVGIGPRYPRRIHKIARR